MIRKRLSSKRRIFIHFVLLFIGWLLFFGAWWRVLSTQRVSYPTLGWLILGALIVIPLITLIWMRHNVNIYERKGPRLQIRAADERYEHDWQGLRINADWADLRVARSIEIKVETELDQKQYVRRL